ncbi:MAG: FAD-dependent monooxygenase, partial [Oceanipulchritudo sp.]
MKGKIDAKVIVAGAGPVGLVTALTLNKRGIPVEIIERDDRPGTHSYALALHPATVKLLRELGMEAEFRIWSQNGPQNYPERGKKTVPKLVQNW